MIVMMMMMMMMMVIAEESLKKLLKISVGSEKAIPLLLKC